MRKLLAVVGIAGSVLAGAAGPAAAAGAHALIQGSGSSWSANAVNQWIADVHSNGLQVVFTSNGSAQGRKDFANNTVDYAVSDIGYQGTDKATGLSDTSQGREYKYLPIVAGGTAFPYQIRVGGQLVRNLRLSGETLAKIFTNQITNWDDPQITKDNNGHALPSLSIIPVVHSEGSGSTYQFTRYLATEYSSIWQPFAGGGATEYFPRQGAQVAENGSDGAMNFISSGAANGAIGYDEYSYALGKNYPVAKVLNKSGYFTLPNQYNVAVALTQAQINQDKSSPDYLLQNLDNVYRYSDKRTYPLSSYSYMIIPTSGSDSKMTTAKRQTLADYLYYAICQGQKEMGPIGYSPLPINLVQAGFDQIATLHQADSNVDLTNESVSTCHNPTFISGKPKENYLAKVAPMPQACDAYSAGPCTGNGNTGQVNPDGSTGGVKVTTSGGSTSTGATSGTTSSAGSGTTGSTSTSGATSSSPGSTVGSVPATGTVVDPVTGQVTTGGSGTTSTDGSTPVVAAVDVPATQSASLNLVLAMLATFLLVVLLVVPPVLTRRLALRGGAAPATLDPRELRP